MGQKETIEMVDILIFNTFWPKQKRGKCGKSIAKYSKGNTI
jgi:hypothetical protein